MNAAFGGGVLGALVMGGTALINSEVNMARRDMERRVRLQGQGSIGRAQIANITLLLDVASATHNGWAQNLVREACRLLAALESDRVVLEEISGVRPSDTVLALSMASSRAMCVETVLVGSKLLYDVLTELRVELMGAPCTEGQGAVHRAIDGLWARCSRISEITQSIG